MVTPNMIQSLKDKYAWSNPLFGTPLREDRLVLVDAVWCGESLTWHYQMPKQHYS